MNTGFKKWLPILAAVAVFAIITLIFFSPLISGKVLRQGDIISHTGMSHEIAQFRDKEHTEPLWTNSMFGGMPAYQISTVYPNNWVTAIDRIIKLGLPGASGYLFLYFLCFFILLLCLEVDPWLAIAGALAYGFSSYFLIIIEAGHNTKANALAYLPAMIGGVILLYRGRFWLGFAVTALFTALEINANHLQITYYGFLFLAILAVSYLITSIRQKTLKSFVVASGLWLGATFLAILPGLNNLYMTYDYAKHTTRGKSELTITADGKSNKDNKTDGLDRNYATQWSYGLGETFTLLIPDFKGGASGSIGNNKDALKDVNPEMRQQVAQSGNAYFGDQPFTSGPVYVGIIIVLLALLGLFIIDHPIKWVLFIGTLLSFFLAWGSNFMSFTNFFMDYVPGYNKFRTVAMALIIAELTLPLLAILAIDRLLKKEWKLDDKVHLKLFKKDITLKNLFIGTVIVVAGFCLIGFVAPDMVNSFQARGEEYQITNSLRQNGASDAQINQFLAEYMPGLEAARKAIFKADALRSFLFAILAAGVVLLYLRKKLSRNLLIAAITVLILVDMWPVAHRYLNAKSFVSKSENNQNFVKSPADEAILADPTLDYRVLNLASNTFNDATTSYWHKSVGGYHAAKLKKYQELIDFHIDKEISEFYGNVNKVTGNDSLLYALMSKLDVLNMMNTRYIILSAGQGELVPLKNPAANGNAWLVRTIKTVPTADAEIQAIGNTKEVAVIRQPMADAAKIAASYNGHGSIQMKSYAPNHLVYESETNAEEFAVFSEIYYPSGWNAYIDGKATEYVCVNYLLRGMKIPAGKHTIEFKFEPAIYNTLSTVALVGSVLLVLTFVGGLYMGFRNKNKQA